MPKIQSVQRKVDKEGLAHVFSIINVEMNGDFQSIPLENDYGFDCYISLFENKTTEKSIKNNYIPLLMRAQLKSGDSHFHNESDDGFLFYAKKKDVDIWRDSNTPVILIVYKKSDSIAYWINIRKYIEEKGYAGKGSLKVYFNKRKVLNKESYNDLLKILYEEQRGLHLQQIKIYKPIYDFLLGDYNTKDLDKLINLQEKYEKIPHSMNFKNDSSINVYIDYALSQRRLNSLEAAINNLENLERKLNIDSFKKDAIILAKIYYYLCVLYIENNQFYEASIKYSLIKNKSYIKAKYKEIKLLNAIINGATGNKKIELRNYNYLIKNEKLKNNILKGVLCLFAGVSCRKYDVYNLSEKYFFKSFKLLKTDPYLLAIANSNLGALYSIMNNSNYSLKYYDNARILFEKQGYKNAVSSIYRNMSDVVMYNKSKDSYSFKDGYNLYRTSFLNKSIFDHDIINEYILNIHTSYSEEFYKLFSKSQNKLTYLYNNGIENFLKAENLSDHLGDLYNKRRTQYQNAKYLYLIGDYQHDYRILKNSLTYYILINEKDGIKYIANYGLKKTDKDYFLEILKWANEIKGDRNAELGRLVFYKEFADYIPEGQIDDVFKIILNSETKGYSFNNNHDYGRYSINALCNLTHRLSHKQTKQLLKLILDNIKIDNLIIRESNLELLNNLNFKFLNKSELLKIILNTEKVLSKLRNKYIIYYIWQNMMVHNGLKGIIFKNILKKYSSNNNNYLESVSLSNSSFNEYRSSNLNKTLINYFGNLLKEESQRETLSSYGEGGFDISNILILLSVKAKYTFKKIIIHYLLNYIKCENLIPSKRTKAIHSLLLLDPIFLKSELKLIEKPLLSIIDNKFNTLENRYKENDTFFPGSHDYKKMKSLSLLCLVKAGFKNVDYILDEYSKLLSGYLKTSSLISIIRSLGEIGIIIQKNIKYSNNIKNMLFQYLYDDNYIISSISIKYFSRLLNKSNNQYLELFLFRLKKAAESNNILLKQASAFAFNYLNKIKYQKLNDIEIILKDDMNYNVRMILRNKI